MPLLFLTFEKTYNIPLSQITMLITINFGIQLFIDLMSALFVDRIGYRISCVLALIFSALGLFCLVVLPELSANAFAGLLVSVIIYALGGGLLEVLVSPIVENCPTDTFAVFMGSARAFYGKYGNKINLDKFMTASCILCILSYLCISLMPIPALSLAGCAVCGLSFISDFYFLRIISPYVKLIARGTDPKF